MQTKTLIEPSAEIVTVTTLKKGDVYRRMHKGTASYDPDVILYGVVTEIGHNGTEAFITALEFNPMEYHGKVKIKAFATDSDLALFSCLPAEFIAAAADLRVGLADDLKAKRAEVTKAEAASELLEQTVALADTLTAPETTSDATTAV